MSLLDRYAAEFVMLTRGGSPDGEGGAVTTWTEGVRFRAALYMEVVRDAPQGGRAGVAREYVVMAPTIAIQYHDVFRRLSDGAIFRATGYSADTHTPPGAGITATRTTAERWDLS